MKISKYYIPVVILSFSITACNDNETNKSIVENECVTLVVDTVYTNADGSLHTATFYDGRYYAFFDTDISKQEGYHKNFYIINPNGVGSKKRDVPNSVVAKPF